MAFDGIDTTVQPLFVPAQQLPAWVDHVRPHLAKMADRSGGRFHATDILECLAGGHMQMWIALRGAELLVVMVTEIHTYPRLRAMRLIGISGYKPLLWRRLLRRVEASAKQDFGCSMMESLHSPEHGVLMPGYKTSHWFSEKVLP